MSGFAKFFKPSTYSDWALRLLSRKLRKYLATTPMIWGSDENVRIGANVQMVDVTINCRSGFVDIDDDAFFGHGVMLLTGIHDLRKKGRLRHSAVPQAGRDITIGKGAWIASNAIVIGPCEIGENAVVGAGSVVTGAVEAGAFYAGNPARLIRHIEFEEDAEPQAG